MTLYFSFFVIEMALTSIRPFPEHATTSPCFSSALARVVARQLTLTSPDFTRSAILLRETLKPAFRKKMAHRVME